MREQSVRFHKPEPWGIESAVEVLLHALREDTIVLDNTGLPVEDQAGYKAEVARVLFTFIGELDNER